jgi:uncharacterized protein
VTARRSLPQTLLLTLALLWAALLGPVAWAQDVLPVPALSGRVIDQTATLSEPQRAALDAKLAAFEAQAGPQIVLLLVPTTAPEDMASYAQRVADTWKIGRKQVGDGVLLLVVKNDRAVRIEVAKALEGAVPDLAARQIIDRAIVPAFRANDYAGGLDAAVDLLMGRIRGEGLPLPAARGGSGARAAAGGLPLEQLGLVVFAAVVAVGGLISAVIGRKAGSALAAVAAGGAAWWLGTGVLMALGAAVAAVFVVGVVGVGNVLQLLLMMSGRGGGGFGGRGGGGFSSGGGGDFGGGGASGKW